MKSRLSGGHAALLAAAACFAFTILAARAPASGEMGEGPDPPLPPLPPSTRGPVAVAFAADGQVVLVAEKDGGTVAVVDRIAGRIVRRVPSGAGGPGAVAALPDGRTALALHADAGVLSWLDWRAGKVEHVLNLPGEPRGIVLLNGGRSAAVTLAQQDELVLVDTATRKVTRRAPLPGRPEACAITPDRTRLLVAAFRSGEVAVLDPRTLREERRVRLSGVNLRGLAVSPDGSAAGVTGQIPANERITREPLDIWTNTLFVFDPRGRPARGDDVAAEGWLDFSAVAAPDPGAAIALEPERFLVAAEGSDELLLVATRGPYLRSYDPGIRRRVRVGARPRALALSPDGREVWVACELENALVVVDPVELRILRRIELGDAGPPDPALRGRYLFGSGLLSRGGQFSCASCHPDGGTDGLTWQFAHVRDGLDRRNTRSLRGGVAGTAPFRWTGADAELDRFLAGEVTGLLGGAPPSPTVLGDIRTFLESLPIARRGAPAEAAAVARGDGLFAGKGACSGCHAGPRHGGTGLKAWVGTTPEGQALDVPHLAGLASSWPYLHDASARTLEEIFSARDPLRVHGGAHALTVEERRDLLAYLRTL